ncbi:MAG: hypothetical protein ACAI44_08985, partial [Candidatus Sericytochromatia bacterium]
MKIDEILYQAAWLEDELQLEAAWGVLSDALQRWRSPRLLVQRAEVLKNAGAIPEAIEDLEAALDLFADEEDEMAYARAHSRLILLRWSTAENWAEISAELRYYNSIHAPDPPRSIPLRHPDPGRRLRIGYLSPDFRVCSAGMLLEMLFLHHPQDEWQVFAYSLVEAPDDPGQQQLRRLLPNWRDVSRLTPEAVCDRIQADEIDILVDLAGHTSLSGLPVLIRQPAPIQLTGLTFNGPLGLPQMPWRLSDEIATPEALLGEKPLYLDSWIWWPEPDRQPGRDPDQIPPLAQIFGCAHHPGRLSQQTLALWSSLLQALPESRLWLKHRFYANQWCREHLQRRFAQFGIGPERLVFLPASNYE